MENIFYQQGSNLHSEGMRHSWIRSPDGLVVGLAPATLEFWVRFPNEKTQGKQAHSVLKYQVSLRVLAPTRSAL